MAISNAVRYRILGGLVVALLISIIGLFILDKEGAKQYQASRMDTLSINPSFDTNRLITPQTRKRIEQANDAARQEQVQEQTGQQHTITRQNKSPATRKAESNQAEENNANDNAHQRPTNANNITAGWALRVGTFGEKANAVNLEQDLKREFPGVASAIKPVDGRNSTLYIVTLGPWTSKKEAERIGRIIQFQRNIKPLVVQLQGN